jgi:hypothetical protein
VPSRSSRRCRGRLTTQHLHHAYTPFAHSRHLCGRNQHIDAVHSLPFSRRQRATLASVSAPSARIHLCFASPALRTFLMPFFPLPHATTPCAAPVCAPQKRTDHGRKFDRDWFNSLRRCTNFGAEPIGGYQRAYLARYRRRRGVQFAVIAVSPSTRGATLPLPFAASDSRRCMGGWFNREMPPSPSSARMGPSSARQSGRATCE